MANTITGLRILLVFPFAATFFLSADWAMDAAFAVYVLAAATDFLDGLVARARGEVSALGAALDPVADKILVAAALLLLTRNGVVAGAGVFAAILIIAREFLIGGLREALGPRGAALPVSPLAKIKTGAQLVAVGLLIAAAPGGVIGPALLPLAAGALWVAVALTVWTGADYARRAAALLKTRPS
ncbi:MAG: CDP-diacylglycerol--glycerol-3-phosphate 3-phosphatidyltransferase [Pseudomonadota bacterium]